MANAESSVLDLPDPCLLQVLQFCAADDHHTRFNASRAHSRLHQAAGMVLRNITTRVSTQQQIDSVGLYLAKHGQHVNSLELTWAGRDRPAVIRQLRQLSQQLQFSSLQLDSLGLQLQPGNGFRGVLGGAVATAALKRLRITDVALLDNRPANALAAALSQLPVGLEHLSITTAKQHRGPKLQIPASLLQHLQHLTYLQLGHLDVVGPAEASPALQPLQALTRLVELELDSLEVAVHDDLYSMLSCMPHLTRLELPHMLLVPGALAAMTQLQHLCLSRCQTEGDVGHAARVSQLLAHLHPLQQLTHLDLCDSMWTVGNIPPASAYTALTASSKLQRLDISGCRLPSGVWQHVLPAGRQLPHLQSLIVAGVGQPSGPVAQPPEASRLISCCPGLQLLKMGSLQCSAELLASLHRLTGLHTLHCGLGEATAQVVQAMCQLTGLRDLNVGGPARMQREGLLLQLTQLKQLTTLRHWTTTGHALASAIELHLSGGDEPVWRQLLRFHLDHPNPAVALQAATALAHTQ